MHIGVNALLLQKGEYSGVHIAMRGLLRSLADTAGVDDRLTVYVQNRNFPGLPSASDTVRYVRPFWPVGSRIGRITYEQFCLPWRVFGDGIDLLHCPAYVMPHWCAKPVVLSVHDMFGLRMPGLCTSANRSHLKRMMPRSLDRAARILVPTEWVRQEVLAWNRDRKTPLPTMDEKLHVVPWGVDTRFQPMEDDARREDVQLKYGLPPKYALFVGRIEPKKNVVQMIQAYFAATLAKGLPHRLVLTGPKGWGSTGTVNRIIRELGLQDKIVHTGFVADEDMPVLYNLASAVLFPSLAEGFGFPLLEAQACGTPVVASDIPALREVSGGHAQFATPAELPALREAIETVLSDESVAERLVADGLKNAARFSWERHAAATRTIYEDVIRHDRDRNA